MKNLLATVALILLTFTCHAQIRLPKILSDHMVLQRNKPITLWGWASPKEKVTVKFNQQQKSVVTDASGNWRVTLTPESAGGPYQLSFRGKNTITLNDILVGEVWVCSGQSNMEWPLALARNAEQEIKEANYPQIRQFLVEKSVSSKPEADVKGGAWRICSPESAENFTAVGYFFARELYNKLKIPIGLVNTTWGGTHSETWTSREGFEQSAEFKDMIARLPELDLETLAKKKNEALMTELKGMNIILPSVGADQWKDLSFDDTGWNTMALPSLWEQKGLPDIDGILWFRKSVTLSAGDSGKEGTLELGMIDDSDETFVNGMKVGETKNKYNEQRVYKIPSGLLKEGKNTIAVRVEDTGGGGGLYGDASSLKLTIGTAAIGLEGNWLFTIESLPAGTNSIGPNAYPTLLFNAMLNPLTHFSIEGVIWYQGEANAERAWQYRTAFPLMINDWRKHFNQGNFPFYFVQLSSFNENNGSSERGSTWAELREAQTMTLALPNTGMAVTTDIGEANDIHPRNKQDVGKRLASIALNKVYGSDIVCSGPMYQAMKVEGNKIRISFTQTGSGLLVKDTDGYVKGFEIAGADQKFYYAQTRMDGNEIIVSAEAVPAPVAVRYAWADNPADANLFNKEGFPASPFRTDDWKGVTAEAKFWFR